MTAAKDNKLKFSQETEIDAPPSVEMFFMDDRDWKRIKRLVNSIKDPSNRWENAGWFSASAVLTTVVSAIASKGTARTIYFVVSGLSAVITIILFSGSKTLHSETATSKGLIVDEMTEIEKWSRRRIKTMKSKAFDIIEARYGSDSQSEDVTNAIKQLINDNRLSFQVLNKVIGTDPHQGVRKKLLIKYKFDGKTVDKWFEEGSFVNLP